MRNIKHYLSVGIILAMMLSFMLSVPGLAAEISAWKTVRVACGINKALYLNEEGEAEGYCSEYLKELAAINQWKMEYVEASWSDSVQNLSDGTVDLLFPTQMTKERMDTMGFSNAIGGYQPIGLFARADSPLCYDDFSGFEGIRVAISAGTSNEAAMQEYAKENHFSYVPVYINKTEEKIQALKDGTVDVIVFSTLNDVPEGKVVALLDYLPFYYCTNIKDTELLKELNYGMNQMLIRHPAVVEDVFYNFINKSISFAYTKEEEQAIKDHGRVVVGIYQETPPLFDVNSAGDYEGVYVDLVQKLKDISGLEIEIVALDRSEDAFDCLDPGSIDFIMDSSDAAQLYSKNKEYVQSEGVMDYYTVGVTKTDFSLTNTEDLTLALTEERKYLVQNLGELYADAIILYYESSKDCLNAVQSGKADITLINSWEYNYQSKNQTYQNLIEWENTRTPSQTVFTSSKEQDEIICSVLNKAIEQISNAEKESAITSNLNRAYSSYDWRDKLYEMHQMLGVFFCLLLIVSAGFSVYIVMRRKTVKTLEETNRQLERANDAKTQFLSRMSHELRTPLNAINGYAEVMEQNLDAHKQDEVQMRTQIESILRAAKYQLAIISDLLDIQKIETGRIELLPTEVDFTGCMENIVQMIQPEADEKQITFSYERIHDVGGSYLVDGVRLQQVLLNLLHNAVKFTPQGGTVKLTAEVIDQDETTNTLKFVISDNGIGMSEDFQQNYLFHRFAQEYQGNTSPYEGCGTGLALSREMMHLMGGEITCKSQRGSGSTFTVILTAKYINKKRRRNRNRQMPNYDLSGVRILLCEDNKMNQDIERRLLERMKCEVELADDGQIGLEKFRQSEIGYYHIILMDIRMPNMDGLEATVAIRTLERTDAGTIPILAVSANAFEEDVKKSLAAGMNEHLSKPVDAKILYQKIRIYCQLPEQQ